MQAYQFIINILLACHPYCLICYGD